MSDAHLRIRQMSLDLSSPSHIPLNVRIAEFREDPDNMDQMTDFVDKVINKAQLEANKQLEEKNKTESKKNGKELVEGIHKGDWPDVKELKCYTFCIAQMTGTLTKKNEISTAKVLTQIEVMLPPELKPHAKSALDSCKNTQAGYKDPCDRTYFTSKCVYDYNPGGLSIINGFKRGRMVTRAQTVIVRMFEAICNCTQSAPLPTRVSSTKSVATSK